MTVDPVQRASVLAEEIQKQYGIGLRAFYLGGPYTAWYNQKAAALKAYQTALETEGIAQPNPTDEFHLDIIVRTFRAERAYLPPKRFRGLPSLPPGRVSLVTSYAWAIHYFWGDKYHRKYAPALAGPVRVEAGAVDDQTYLKHYAGPDGLPSKVGRGRGVLDAARYSKPATAADITFVRDFPARELERKP